jgi:hypothetical protein
MDEKDKTKKRPRYVSAYETYALSDKREKDPQTNQSYPLTMRWKRQKIG